MQNSEDAVIGVAALPCHTVQASQGVCRTRTSGHTICSTMCSLCTMQDRACMQGRSHHAWRGATRVRIRLGSDAVLCITFLAWCGGDCPMIMLQRLMPQHSPMHPEFKAASLLPSSSIMLEASSQHHPQQALALPQTMPDHAEHACPPRRC